MPAGVGVAFAALVAFRVIRNYDAGLHRAQKRATAGDLDGAIADLQEQIEDKGPTQNRVNLLGIWLLQRNQCDEAAALFRKAEELGGVKGVCRTNLGLALLKGGKPEEAATGAPGSVTNRPSESGNELPGLAPHRQCTGRALGRWDEARAHWLASETAARSMSLSRAHRDAIGKDLEECRRKLDEGPHAKPKPEGLEEL